MIAETLLALVVTGSEGAKNLAVQAAAETRVSALKAKACANAGHGTFLLLPAKPRGTRPSWDA
jgi:hypothetical protein